MLKKINYFLKFNVFVKKIGKDLYKLDYKKAYGYKSVLLKIN